MAVMPTKIFVCRNDRSAKCAVSSGNIRITGAEQQLLKMLARGMKYQEIANQRVTSPETVRKQVDLLLAKLKLNNREELIAWAVESGYGKLEIEA